MALSPKRELRQSQSLVMTPQLMQAIKLLQLSNLDLAAYVEGELERNPLLEQIGEGEGEADRRTPDRESPSFEQAAAPDWRDSSPSMRAKIVFPMRRMRGIFDPGPMRHPSTTSWPSSTTARRPTIARPHN
mgnify:CR=1 FL=1